MSTANITLWMLAGMLPLIAVACLAALIVHWGWQRHRARRAGISPDAPGCARCFYIARGWNSSACPECGADARQVGVVTGPRLNLALKLIATAALSLAIMYPACMLISGWLFVRHAEIGMWRFIMPGPPGYTVHIRTRRESGFLVPERYDTELIIDPSNTIGPISVATSRREGHWEAQQPEDGASDAEWKRHHFGPGAEAPNTETVAQFVVDAIGGGVTVLVHGQAGVIANQIAASRAGAPGSVKYAGGGASAGSGWSSYIWRPAAIGSLIAPLLAALGAVLLVYRRHRPGWRPAREGEWLEAPTLEVPFREAPQRLRTF